MAFATSCCVCHLALCCCLLSKCHSMCSMHFPLPSFPPCLSSRSAAVMTFGNMQISLAGTPIGKVLNVSAVKLWLWGFPFLSREFASLCCCWFSSIFAQRFHVRQSLEEQSKENAENAHTHTKNREIKIKTEEKKNSNEIFNAWTGKSQRVSTVAGKLVLKNKNMPKIESWQA